MTNLEYLEKIKEDQKSFFLEEDFEELKLRKTLALEIIAEELINLNRVLTNYLNIIVNKK
jgi:hypothetical protein